MKLTKKQKKENAYRAAHAEAALRSYAGDEAEADPETAVQDLLTDLMHLAAENGWDFDNLLRMATTNFNAEARGED